MGANRGVEGANRRAPEFSTIIAQQLWNLLPAMLAQVSNRGNVGNQNGNVVNENVQENVGNVIVNGNRVGNGYLRKGQKSKSKRTKSSTEWKSVKSQSQQKSQPDKVKVKVKVGAEIEEIVNGPTRTHLMDRVSPL
ncbi:hypothetical protein Tco_0044055, partial [Tanacetum coccineum]